MAFRTIEINHPADLHIRDGQLCIEQKDVCCAIPVEDIASLILSGPDIRISSNALATMAEAETMVVFCGRGANPNGILVSTNANSRQSLIGRQQVNADQRLKDELWAQIIEMKIRNQSACLSLLGLPGYERIAAYAERVEPGDPTNREGTAASEYFPLLHKGLNRQTDDPFNSILNYGYAVIRTSIVKSIIST